MAETLEQLITNQLDKHGSNPAVIIPDKTPLSVTFNEFNGAINGLRKDLIGGGIRKGDSVSLSLINGYPFLVAFLAATWAGAKAASLNPGYTTDEFSFYLQDTESKVLILLKGTEDKNAREAAAKLNIPVWELEHSNDSKELKLHYASPLQAGDKPADEKPKGEDIALFLHTSGTTSKPKGVPLTHKNLTTSIKNIAQTYELSEKDRSLIVMPLFHVHGLLGATLSTLSAGGAVVVPPRFSASTFWKDIKDHNVTWYSAVPTIHQILLLRADQDTPAIEKLRFIRSCSSSLAPNTLIQLEEKFKVPVLEAYGMTEASHQMASNPLPPHGPRKPGSVGRGTNVQIAILDDEGNRKKEGDAGEVCIKGENVTHGYHNNPTANTANWTKDGWFRTGDQGYLDPEGYLFLTGRIKELINRGGEKISPIEIDSVLLENPAVAEAVAFAIPDEKYGEQVGAAVVLKEGQKVTEKDIIDYLKSKLSAFKVPTKLFIADSLPRTATGKIQRRVVAEHFLKQSEKKIL